MLNRHPAVVIPPETKLLVGFHRLPVWIRRRTLQRMNRDLRIDLPLDLAGRDVPTPEVFRCLRERYLQRLRRGAGVTHFGEKTPEHTARLDWLGECFPRAPVVALVRDGRDVAASLTRVPWLHCSHRAGALVWKFYMRHLSATIVRNEMPLMVLRFENLIADPEGQLGRVLRHIGLSDPGDVGRMVRPDPVRDRGAFPDREQRWKGRALQPIDPSVVCQGRQTLNADRLREVESLIGHSLQQWGYLSSEALSGVVATNRGCGLRATVDVGLTACQLPLPLLVGEAIYRWNCNGAAVSG